MKFESGMLGFLIVVLAIGGGIAGTYLLSAEPTTQEITKYNLVADISGLFDTDESPQYFDYDLSQNYTGYYTEDTVINGVNYWGGADFTPTGVNNYPIRYGPQNETSGQYDLMDYNSSLTTSDPPGNVSTYSMGVNYKRQAYGITDNTGFIMGNYATLSSVVTALGLDSYDVIELYCTSENWADVVFFGSTDQIPSTSPYTTTYVNKSVYDTYPEGQGYYLACFSCKINMTAQRVDFYYGLTASTQTFVRSADLSDSFVLYSTGLVQDYPHSVINTRAYDTQNIDYMDISKGVTVTGVGA